MFVFLPEFFLSSSVLFLFLCYFLYLYTSVLIPYYDCFRVSLSLSLLDFVLLEK